MSVYREIIDTSMPAALNELVPISPDIYEPVSHLLFGAFYEAVYNGMHSTRCAIYMPLHSKRKPEEPEIKAITSSMAKHIFMGREIGLQARKNAEITAVIDAVEYVAERLGCKEYS